MNSNSMDEFKQSHLMNCIYTCCFSILVLQKLYSVYYIASSEPVFHFNLNDNQLRDASFYEGLFVEACSTRNLRIYCEGMTLNRIEKMKDLVLYPPSYKYLNVCVREAKNCGKCEKCVRTLLALDILGALDIYRDVFDVDYYKSHRQDYLAKMFFFYKVCGNSEYVEIYPLLKNQIRLASIIRIIPNIISYRMKHLLSGAPGVYHFIRNSYRKLMGKQ